MIQWIKNLLNRSAKIKELESTIEDLVADHNIIIEKLGEISVYCDKCNGGADKPQCFKCNSTGIVKNKQLHDWPW